MSGALNSILGGGGLGAIMNIASMFFPPLAIMNGLGNLMSSAIGGALNGVVDSMTKNMGMPKFLGNMLKDIISKVIPGMQGGDQDATAVDGNDASAPVSMRLADQLRTMEGASASSDAAPAARHAARTPTVTSSA